MTTCATHLLNFCQQLGIDERDVLQAESPVRFHFDSELPGTAWKDIEPLDLRTLGDCFSGAIDLDVRIGKTSLGLISAGEVVAQAENNLTHIVQLDRCELRIEIDKTVLAERVSFESPCKTIFYIFFARFLRFLAAPLPVLDSNLFQDRYTPTIVLVSSVPDLWWDGSLLTVIGEDVVADAVHRKRLETKVSANLQPRRRRRLDQYHETARATLSWLSFELKNVTPLHFLGTSCSGPAVQEVEVQMARQMMHAIVLFTANRSKYKEWTEGQTIRRLLEAQYGSDEQTVALELGPETPSAKTEDLVRLALWPFQTEGNDRLIVFGKVVARALEPRLSSEPAAKKRNYRSLLEMPAKLQAEAAWSYQTLVGRRIEQHFDAMRRAEASAVETSREISLALGTVTQGLSETLLATIGVVVLTLLASVVKGDTDGEIFRIGMQAYAAYLLVFQLIYRMTSVWHSHHLTVEEWKERKETFRAALSPATIIRLTEPVRKRKQQFRWWFGITAIIYAAVAVGIWLLPDYILQLLNETPVIDAVPQN